MGAGHYESSWDSGGNRVPLWCASPRSPSSRLQLRAQQTAVLEKGSAWFGSVGLRQTHPGPSRKDKMLAGISVSLGSR